MKAKANSEDGLLNSFITLALSPKLFCRYSCQIQLTRVRTITPTRTKIPKNVIASMGWGSIPVMPLPSATTMPCVRKEQAPRRG